MCEICSKLTINTSTSFWCLCLLWTNLTHCSDVSIANFKQVNASWVLNLSIDEIGCICLCQHDALSSSQLGKGNMVAELITSSNLTILGHCQETKIQNLVSQTSSTLHFTAFYYATIYHKTVYSSMLIEDFIMHLWNFQFRERLQSALLILSEFNWINFYSPWNHQKTSGFLTISGWNRS